MNSKLNFFHLKISNLTDNNIQIYASYLEELMGFSFEESIQYVKEKNAVLQATIKGIAVGFLSYLTSDNNNLYIDDFDVFPEYQRMGIGSLMIQELEKIASKMNTTEIKLHVAENNTQAIKFYSKNHFIKSELIENFYQNRFNAYLFTKEITSSI